MIAQRIDELAEVMRREMGKPHADGVLEAALAVDHLAWAAGHAEKVLERRSVLPGLVMSNQAATVGYRPLGVVGVIGPWNYPVFTPMGSIGYALAAGNAVVFKPSEYTPVSAPGWPQRSPRWSDRPVLQVVTGGGETGAALCRAGVDKVAFTGSTATGRRVMAACAETLTPVVIEAGGKDAVLVDADADLDAAADAAIWGACSNAGQTCTGVERVYVHERVYDDFLARILDKAKDLHADAGPDSKIGPITMPKQLDVIRSHIEDAIARGGKAVLGGPDAVGERFVQPTILVDVPEDSAAVQEETFGPTVTVTRVRDMDEAVARDQRHPLRPRLDRLRQGARHGDRGADPVRHDRGQRRDHVRGDPLPAVRRRGRLRLRPDPRGRRAPGVQLCARDRTAAVQADDEPHLVHAHGEGRTGSSPVWSSCCTAAARRRTASSAGVL